MKLQELSNPEKISTSFELVSNDSFGRSYKNITNNKILKCVFQRDGYSFEYDNTKVQTPTTTAEALSVFKTVLYDFKINVLDKKENTVYFTASTDEPYRIKLYDTLSKLMIKCGYIRLENTADVDTYITNMRKNAFYSNSIKNQRDSIFYLFVRKDFITDPITEVKKSIKTI